MKTPLKKVCILALSAGIGKMVFRQSFKLEMTQDERCETLWNAKQISDAGQEALNHCGVKIDKSRMKQAKAKIDEFKKDTDKFDIAETLSFLFLGLNDINNGDPMITAVENAVLNFMTAFDPNLENEDLHSIALKKYERWIK